MKKVDLSRLTETEITAAIDDVMSSSNLVARVIDMPLLQTLHEHDEDQAFLVLIGAVSQLVGHATRLGAKRRADMTDCLQSLIAMMAEDGPGKPLLKRRPKGSA